MPKPLFDFLAQTPLDQPHVRLVKLRDNGPEPSGELGQLKAYRDAIRNLRGVERGALDFDEISEFMQHLDSMAVVSMPLAFPQFHRGRKCHDGKRWNNVSDLSYPPKVADVGIGRVNLKGQPVLYATDSSAAVFCECRVERDDVIQVLIFRPKPETKTLAMAVGGLNKFFRSAQPVFSGQDFSLVKKFFSHVYWHRNDQRIEELVSKLILFDAFIAEQFGQLAGSEAEYKFTATIAEKLLRPPYDAIVYPSVAFTGATNIAMLPEAFDKNFFPIGSTLLRCKRPLGYGIWTTETLATSGGIKPNGDILWMEAVPPISENVFISCRQEFLVSEEVQKAGGPSPARPPGPPANEPPPR